MKRSPWLMVGMAAALSACEFLREPDDPPLPPTCPNLVDFAPPNGTLHFVAGTGAGVEARIRGFDEAGVEVMNFAPFQPGFTGGLNLAMGDVTDDEFDDLVVAQASQGGQVRVFDGRKLGEVSVAGELLITAIVADFSAFGEAYTGGVDVGVGDVDGDDRPELALGMVDGGQVSVVDGSRIENTGAELAAADRLASFGAFGAAFAGGVDVAIADIDCDEFGEVIVGMRSGGTRVIGFDGAVLPTDGTEPPPAAFLADFDAFDAETDGVRLATGDVEGDRSDDIIVGTASGVPTVRVFAGNATVDQTLGGAVMLAEAAVEGIVAAGSVEVAPVDGDDGNTDVVVAAATSGDGVGLLDGADLSPDPGLRGAGLWQLPPPVFPLAEGLTVAFPGTTDYDPLPVPVFTGRPVIGVAGTGLSTVTVLDLDGSTSHAFFGFNQDYVGGVSLATGDVNADGVDDIVIAAKTGLSQVRVIDGTRLDDVTRAGEIASTAILGDFFAFGTAAVVGAEIAVGDVNGDDVADIVVTPNSGLAQVRVVDGSMIDMTGVDASPVPEAILADFFAFDLSFTGAANPALGDVDGDGVVDLVVGASSGSQLVQVVDGAQLIGLTGVLETESLITSFLAFDPIPFNGGVSVAVGDVDGDGFDDVVAGMRSGGSILRVLDGEALAMGTLTELGADFPFNSSFLGGMHVATALGTDGNADIGATPNANGVGFVSVRDGLTLEVIEQVPMGFNTVAVEVSFLPAAGDPGRY